MRMNRQTDRLDRLEAVRVRGSFRRQSLKKRGKEVVERESGDDLIGA